MSNTPSKNASIGIFDSGVGGLSIMREIIRLLPQENLIYLGDTARVPYGNKSPKTILHYSIENASFLLEQNIKLLVIACHTACAYALESLQSYLPIPIIGVIMPGFENLMKATRNHSVAILGTTPTIASGIYQKLILKVKEDAKIHSVACPLFVPLIEEGFSDHVMIELAAKEYLTELSKTPIDAALLACTHYPLIYDIIKKTLPEKVTVVDPSAECAEKVALHLTESKQLAQRKTPSKYQFYVSDNPEKFKRLAEKFLKIPVPHVELTDLLRN